MSIKVIDARTRKRPSFKQMLIRNYYLWCIVLTFIFYLVLYLSGSPTGYIYLFLTINFILKFILFIQVLKSNPRTTVLDDYMAKTMIVDKTYDVDAENLETYVEIKGWANVYENEVEKDIDAGSHKVEKEFVSSDDEWDV